MNNNIIMKCKFGSTLYGTSGPNSDIDIKGIAFQSSKDFILNGARKHIEYSSTGSNDSKNSSEDIDIEIYTIHAFIKHALDGQTVAMDMLHCPDNMLIENSYIWQEIRKNRSKFYSKNIESFISYALGQASKYGIKGSRLNDAKAVLDWLTEKILKHNSPVMRLSECDLTTFPQGEHIIRHDADANGIPMIEVCNRKFNIQTKLCYAKDIVQKFYDNYGERAKKAASDEGIDWKAISHAFRAAYQTKQLFTEGDIIFPLKEAEFLKQIKYGEISYSLIGPKLEELIDEVKEIKGKCSLPEQPDREFWNDWLYEIMQFRISRGM